jgi:ankyrin repeat protein
MVQLLFKRGFDPNRPRVQGGTIFHTAVSNSSVDVVKVFLENGADPNRTDNYGRAALAVAARAGNKSVAELLRVKGANEAGLKPVDELIGACLQVNKDHALAILNSHPGIMQTLTPEDFDVLVEAASMNQIEKMHVFAAAGFDLGGVGRNGSTPLHAAAWHGYVDMVRLLVDFHAPVNVRDNIYNSTPLAWAKHGSVLCRSADELYAAIIKMLVEAGGE